MKSRFRVGAVWSARHNNGMKLTKPSIQGERMDTPLRSVTMRIGLHRASQLIPVFSGHRTSMGERAR
jgi:hypothetical protein